MDAGTTRAPRSRPRARWWTPTRTWSPCAAVCRPATASTAQFSIVTTEQRRTSYRRSRASLRRTHPARITDALLPFPAERLRKPPVSRRRRRTRARAFPLLEDRFEDGLAVFDGHLEIDSFAVLFTEFGARFAQAFRDGVVGDGRGRLVLPPLRLDVLRIELSDPPFGESVGRGGSHRGRVRRCEPWTGRRRVRCGSRRCRGGPRSRGQGRGR